MQAFAKCGYLLKECEGSDVSSAPVREGEVVYAMSWQFFAASPPCHPPRVCGSVSYSFENEPSSDGFVFQFPVSSLANQTSLGATFTTYTRPALGRWFDPLDNGFQEGRSYFRKGMF